MNTHCGTLFCKWVNIKTNQQDIYVFTARIDTQAANKCYQFFKVRIKHNNYARYPTFTTWSSIISGPTKVRTVPKKTVRTPTTIKPTATLDLFIAIVSYWQTVLCVPVLLVSTDRQKNPGWITAGGDNDLSPLTPVFKWQGPRSSRLLKPMLDVFDPLVLSPCLNAVVTPSLDRALWEV